MCAAIGRVIELIRPHRVLELLSVALGLVVVVLGVVKGNRGDREDLGSEKTEEIDFALGLGVGHVDLELVAERPADVRETDTGVACCAFDYSSAGLEEAAFFGITDDVEGSAVWGESVGVGERTWTSGSNL